MREDFAALPISSIEARVSLFMMMMFITIFTGARFPLESTLVSSTSRAQLGRVGGSRSGLGSSNKIACQLSLSLSLSLSNLGKSLSMMMI